MLLSVCVVTCNHALFIDRAIRSIVEQEVDFELEIWIGDDASTDATGDLLRRLTDELPATLRVLTHPTRLGMRGNLLATLEKCRGDYIAFLDGDDFWSDPAKLARQVALLQARPDMSFCFHRVRDLRADDGPEGLTPAVDPPATVDLPYLLQSSNPVAFGSVVARRALLADLDRWWLPELKLGDWPACIMLGSRGTVGYIAEEMARYRIHGGGSWSALSPHVRVAYVLQVLAHIRTLVASDAVPLVQQQISELVRWWANDAARLADADCVRVLDVLLGTGDVRLMHLLLAEQLRVTQRLDANVAWLEHHAKSWETCASDCAVALARAEEELAHAATGLPACEPEAPASLARS